MSSEKGNPRHVFHMNPLRDIASLFFPPVCAACGSPLADPRALLCNRCQWDIPLTRYWERDDNPLAERLREHIPVVRAAAFYFFAHQSPFRDLVHDFKYRGRWRPALRMGEWFGDELAPFYGDVDVIVPVPLHLRRRLKRGYNQSEYIARGIGMALGKPVDTRSVVRTRHTRSQAAQRGGDRWDNVEGIFGVRRPSTLAGRHVLLVDDVLTTGATILSLAEAVLRAVPDCRVSIAALATTQQK
jgi:ComF family protein